MSAISFGGITVTAPPFWRDFTDEVEAEDKPFTLARPELNGGSLQFSPGLYRSGPVPDFPTVLREMAEEFGQKRNFGPILEEALGAAGGLAWVALTYRVADGDNDFFVRLWYVSDGPNIALITYVNAWDAADLREELAEAEAIVKSLRFD